MIRRNPNLYEINTRVWIKRFGSNLKISDVPRGYWLKLKNKGIDAVWLMGIWKTNKEAIKKYCFEDWLVHSYQKALKDWKEEDVIGSPYSIDSYEINPELGSEIDLLKLKQTLNEIGLKLIVDFIPNHFSVSTGLLETRPEIFLSAPRQFYEEDTHTFFKPFEGGEKYYAHGRDPFFPAWQDTIQVNYYSNAAREFMINELLKLTKFADGVRCDMAILSMNNVFGNTWSGVLSALNIERPKEEFWKLAIEIIKDYRRDFLFIAEAYWDLEYELQRMGFDFTYDKKLLDRLLNSSPDEIKAHLHAEDSYQQKSVRFVENHDEERALYSMGKQKSKAAAVIISTIYGMTLYYDGQFEGKKTKLPLQLAREPVEKEVECIKEFYDNLLGIVNDDAFHNGEWIMKNVEAVNDSDRSNKNLLAWQWRLNTERRLVVVNFSGVKSRGRIRLDVKEYPLQFKIYDLLNKVEYLRQKEEVESMGLYIELEAYQSHIFSF